MSIVRLSLAEKLAVHNPNTQSHMHMADEAPEPAASPAMDTSMASMARAHTQAGLSDAEGKSIDAESCEDGCADHSRSPTTATVHTINRLRNVDLKHGRQRPYKARRYEHLDAKKACEDEQADLYPQASQKGGNILSTAQMD